MEYKSLTPKVIYDKQWYIQNRIDNKEKKKQYVIDNKEKIDLKQKEWRLKNKDIIAVKHKAYRELNKEHNAEKDLQYKRTHQDEIKANRSIRFTCECGIEMTKGAKWNHEAKSEQHLEFIKAKTI